MIKGKKVVAVITAKGHSRALPNKNIRILAGKPLIYYSIKAAKDSKLVDRVIVSTDSPKIAKIAEKYGAEAPFLRPAELATDTAHTPPVITHALKFLEEKEGFHADIVVTLQPTSPLREAGAIDSMIETLIKKNYDSVISVVNVGGYHPWWMSKMKGDKLVPFLDLPPGTDPYNLERQQLPTVLKQNGSVYVTRAKALFDKDNIIIAENCGAYLMDETHSLDIDGYADLLLVETVMKDKSVKFVS